MSRLAEVCGVFLRLGLTAFGGPAAHVAMMEDEVVRRRAWLDRAAFLDLVAATHLVPGPNSTELAIHLGYRRAGWPGLFVAGAAFILPAFAMVWALAWFYVRWGRLPAVLGVLAGLKPVVLAVVVHACWSFGRTALKTRRLAALAALSAAALLAGAHELLVLGVAGLAAVRRPRRSAVAAAVGWLPIAGAAASGAGTPAALFWIFAKIGSVLFGSGYVLVAYLRAELVTRRPWLTEVQLLDAVAVGQLTPGPVFTTATFVGYLVSGNAGAIAATAGIFLPAFLFVAASGPLVPRLRRSPAAGDFLDGLVAASIAFMAVVAVGVLPGAVPDALSLSIALVALVLLVRFRVHAGWLMLAGAAVGAARSLF
ncbi:MAG: chromate efflux transporter [Vicinamibacteria bacterium]